MHKKKAHQGKMEKYHEEHHAHKDGKTHHGEAVKAKVGHSEHHKKHK